MTNMVIALSSFSFRNRLLPENVSRFRGELKRGGLQNNAVRWECVPRSGSRTRSLMVKASGTSLTVSSTISTDIPFDEAPEASFDEYLDDMERVFEAIFPEKEASERLSEDEWRIYMVPINALFRTIQPVVEMRLKCNTNVFDDTSKVLVIQMIKSELKGLDEIQKRSEISLGMQGTICCHRMKQQSRLKGETHLSMTFILHPMMALLTENVSRDAAELVLRSLTENMKHSVNASLLSDYAKFKKERLSHLKLQRSIDLDSQH